MATLLRIDSSPLGTQTSFSRQLTAEFVNEWLRKHPGGKVITRDLALTAIPALDAEWINATRTPDLDPVRQREVLALSDELIAELEAADEYVIGLPMHNFTIPGTLKLWLDQVVRAGKTFRYEGGGPVGLLKGKKATFLVASGGVYKPGTPAGAMNFAEPYLRTIFGFIGVTDTNVINISGTARMLSGVDRQTILEPALAAVRTPLKAA